MGDGDVWKFQGAQGVSGCVRDCQGVSRGNRGCLVFDLFGTAHSRWRGTFSHRKVAYVAEDESKRIV